MTTQMPSLLYIIMRKITLVNVPIKKLKRKNFNITRITPVIAAFPLRITAIILKIIYTLDIKQDNLDGNL